MSPSKLNQFCSSAIKIGLPNRDEPIKSVSFWKLLDSEGVVWKVKPFVPNAPFLCPLKTSKNRKLFWCFQGLGKECIGNKKVNREGYRQSCWNLLPFSPATTRERHAIKCFLALYAIKCLLALISNSLDSRNRNVLLNNRYLSICCLSVNQFGIFFGNHSLVFRFFTSW